ncbi:hypothetical protein ACFW1P_33005 [Paenibacillus sp. NPDC058910]|uniref:iron-containing alcohol dehydrogenase n=1 Tax=unclassified Paenibacillus TaxID=185978 RepID=UPI00367B64E6
MQRDGADVIAAVGSGMLHRSSRYAAYTAGTPFTSMPITPSVGDLNSVGAPIVICGEKITDTHTKSRICSKLKRPSG